MTTITDSKICEIVKHPFDHDGWTVQGLGMIRLYLDDEHRQRLHIWDPGSATPEVSTVHDHPWDFRSRLIVGRLDNQRYVVDGSSGLFSTEDFFMSKLVCGVGGGLIGEPRKVTVAATPLERYYPGDAYTQEAVEFHESFPSAGAVTVIERSFREDRDIATVCWRTGDWVSAEPRPATREEITHFTNMARSLL